MPNEYIAVYALKSTVLLDQAEWVSDVFETSERCVIFEFKDQRIKMCIGLSFDPIKSRICERGLN